MQTNAIGLQQATNKYNWRPWLAMEHDRLT